MDRTLTQIVKFIDGDDRTLQQAAAHVVGALRTTEASAVAALASALESSTGSGDREVQIACLQALENVESASVLEHVIPLLGEPGDVGHCAMRVISSQGAKALPGLKKRFATADELERRRILSVAGRVRGASGVDLILMALEAGHAEQVLALGERLSEELASLKGKDQAVLVDRIEKFLGDSKKSSLGSSLGRESAGAAVDLLARVLRENGTAKLLQLSVSRNPPQVRRAALLALARAPEGGSIPDEVLTKVLSYLKDPDYTHVVAPAIALLESATLGVKHANVLLRCLEGDDPSLRRFAVTALQQVDTPRAAKALVTVLEGDNPDLQERAAVSLSRLSAAVSLLFKELCDAPNRESAWRLAQILAPHSAKFNRDQVRKLATAAVNLLESGDPRAEALVSVLGDVHFDTLSEIALKRARPLRAAREAGAILNVLRPLQRDGIEIGTEVRFELALAELMISGNDVVREVRLRNPGLRRLEALAQDPEFGLLNRLKKEQKVLTAEEFYLVGAHFSERAFGERAIGGDLLKWLIVTFPEEASAAAAANKLVMEGFPPPPEPARRAAKEREIAQLAAAEVKAEQSAVRAKEREERELQKEAARAAMALERAAARAVASKKKKTAKAAAEKLAAKAARAKTAATKSSSKATKNPAKKVAKKAAKKVAKNPVKKPAKKAAKKVAKKAAKKTAKKVAKKAGKKSTTKKKPSRR